MSHFLAFVLVDARASDPGHQAHQMMRTYFSPDDPDAKCDGFVIGGQYDGLIWGKEQHYNLSPAAYQRRYGLDVVKAEDNIRPVTKLDPNVTPYALITPDGQWHDGEGKAYDAWAQAVQALLVQHYDCLVVAIDCHR